VSAPRAPGDHFSSVSTAYAAFRPRYPSALFAYVSSIAQNHRRAWDCGAGSGQASADLAEYFGEVVATDISEKQISSAQPHTRVRWVVSTAESTPLASGSMDLIAIAQALHWFDHARFNEEVRRVAAPGAAIVAWMYGTPRMNGPVGGALDRLMFEILGTYWPPERSYVISEYRTIPFPFPHIAAPTLSLEESWSLERIAGYARSWSATVQYRATHDDDPVESFEREARQTWADGEPRTIVWPLTILAGRVA
jgi:SAM-dependent methyltransferase